MMITDDNTRSLKQNNRFLILNTLRTVQEISIANLAKITELSKPTIKKVLDHYSSLGLVKEVGKGNSTEEGGKRPLLYRFDEDYSLVISLHVGPDFINGALLNFRGEIVESEFVHLKHRVSFDEVLELLVQYIIRFKEERGREQINAIVLALPGIVDGATGVLKYSPHFTYWQSNLPFRSELEKRIGTDIPLYADNVNRYQAFIEMLEGEAVGVKDFATVDALEEGVGSGLITGGRLSHGTQYIAGEIGHMVVNTSDGCNCICGGNGCFEAEVSWRNVLRLIDKGREHCQDSVLLGYKQLHPKDLFEAQDSGDRLAVEVMDKITTYFARGINNLIMVNDPEMIIIQGIYNDAGERFLGEVKKKVDNMTLLTMKRDTRICFSKFGIDRGVRGAGLYLLSKFFEQDKLYS